MRAIGRPSLMRVVSRGGRPVVQRRGVTEKASGVKALLRRWKKQRPASEGRPYTTSILGKVNRSTTALTRSF